MKSFFKLAALVAAFGFALAFAGCSNGGDDNGALLAVTSGGGSGGTDTSNPSGGGTNPTTPTSAPTPTPAATYTITFNSNDGSETPATATQTFTEKVPQALKTISELGFSKSGFNFAGWGTSADAGQASYADASSYTATADATLYALWSEIPVYNVNVKKNSLGTVTPNRATAPAGTIVTLTISPTPGYELETLTVRSISGITVDVNGTGNSRTFTMPAKDVNVTTTFNLINYNVNIETAVNGNVEADYTTATVGTHVGLTINPATGYELERLNVIAADGTSVISVSGPGNYLYFPMPANDINITATFKIINYNIIINVGADANGTVAASASTATFGTNVVLTITPVSGYELTTLNVTAEGGASVEVSGTGNSRNFKMPAKNVTITAKFKLINYSINVKNVANGRVTARATATIGNLASLIIIPDFGYRLATLNVTDDGGTPVEVSGTGNPRYFKMPASNVIVTAAFEEIPEASGAYTEIGNTTINETQYDLVTFGLWPQTIKSSDVNIDESKSKTVGCFTYYKGSDNQWYAKLSDCYYKVEPIKWRVLTVNYNGTGKKLLLAEDVLANCVYYDYKTNYVDGHYVYVYRSISGNSICPNNYEHSRLRAFLNGLSYQRKEGSNSAQTTCNDFLEKGFLQTAFTTAELSKITDTSVDNSVRSTLPDNYDSLSEDEKQHKWGNGNNEFASDTPTTDKVFLLSEQEATKNEYGFDVYNAYASSSAVNTRLRKATDYAKRDGVSLTSGYSSWRLRSPSYSTSGDYVCYVERSNQTSKDWVDSHSIGVVPALCVGN